MGTHRLAVSLQLAATLRPGPRIVSTDCPGSPETASDEKEPWANRTGRPDHGPPAPRLHPPARGSDGGAGPGVAARAPAGRADHLLLCCGRRGPSAGGGAHAPPDPARPRNPPVR